MFTLGVLAVLAACLVVPRAAGATPYTVLTGSMSPSIEAGAVVIVKPEPFEQVGVGDVITYQVRSDDPATVTHRVEGVTWSAAYGRQLITRGDANGAADPDPVRAVQVRGVVWYQVPWVGRAARYGDPAVRAGLVTAAGWALLAYAALSLLLGFARIIRRSDEDDAGPSAGAPEPAVADIAFARPREGDAVDTQAAAEGVR